VVLVSSDTSSKESNKTRLLLVVAIRDGSEVSRAAAEEED